MLDIQPFSRRQFASDNYSGMCPEALDSLLQANQGHTAGYGDDPWTQHAADKLREIFETDCEIFFVFTGTAANSLAISSLCQSYHSILCHEVAHLECDECGAPEFFSNGTKVLLLPGERGKIAPEAIIRMATKRDDIHYPKPKVISLTQSTELGTIYRPNEISAISETCREFGLKLHMDGARFANAVAGLDIAPAEITWKAGVDVLCFGGAKNGGALGEAVVFFDRQLAQEFDYRCKQAGQLASKMRFISAPWCGMLEKNTWLDRANHANQMAKQLYDGLQRIPEVDVLYETEANAVFVKLPDEKESMIRKRGWKFYSFIAGEGSRFMCSWDTQPDDVQALLNDFETVFE